MPARRSYVSQDHTEGPQAQQARVTALPARLAPHAPLEAHQLHLAHQAPSALQLEGASAQLVQRARCRGRRGRRRASIANQVATASRARLQRRPVAPARSQLSRHRAAVCRVPSVPSKATPVRLHATTAPRGPTATLDPPPHELAPAAAFAQQRGRRLPKTAPPARRAARAYLVQPRL